MISPWAMGNRLAVGGASPLRNHKRCQEKTSTRRRVAVPQGVPCGTATVSTDSAADAHDVASSLSLNRTIDG